MLKQTSRVYFLIVLLIATVLCFYRIGLHDVSEWDEARNGMNALEMLRNGDYINLYFGGVPDTWNAKPPLLTWLIVLCYKLFGLNEFALRLPVAISAVLFFAYFYKLVEMYAGSKKAFVACLLLFSCKAIVGWHVGLTGDYDMLLVLFLTASAYYFLQFIDFDKKHSIYLTAIFTGLAFYTKGPAAVLFLPGLLIYTLIRGKAGYLFRSIKLWLSAGIFLCISGSWFLLLTIYGKQFKDSFYGSKNAWETMLVYDTFKRLTNANFESSQPHARNKLFVVHALDSQMNLWNYLFYVAVAIGIYMLYKNRADLKGLIACSSNRLIVFSTCIIIPYAVLLTFAQTQHAWYMAPVFSFVAFITVQGIFYLIGKWRSFKWIIVGLFLFTFGRQLYYVHTLPCDMHATLSKKNSIFKQSEFIITITTPQQMLLYLSWMNMGFVRTSDVNEIGSHAGKLLIIEKDKLKELSALKVKPVAYFEDYCLATIL